jgi:hypothetical protein
MGETGYEAADQLIAMRDDIRDEALAEITARGSAARRGADNWLTHLFPCGRPVIWGTEAE